MSTSSYSPNLPDIADTVKIQEAYSLALKRKALCLEAKQSVRAYVWIKQREYLENMY